MVFFRPHNHRFYLKMHRTYLVMEELKSLKTMKLLYTFVQEIYKVMFSMYLRKKCNIEIKCFKTFYSGYSSTGLISIGYTEVKKQMPKLHINETHHKFLSLLCPSSDKSLT